MLSDDDSLHFYLVNTWMKHNCIHLDTDVIRYAALTLVNLNGTSQGACSSAHEHVGLSSRYLASESTFVGLLLATLDV